MGKKRIGALSVKTFFPNNGDLLEDLAEGICWEMQKVCVERDTRTGTKIRHGLLVGHHPDMGDEPIPFAIHDRDGSQWLEGIDVIQRRVRASQGGGFRKYRYSEKTETWQEEGQEPKD